MAIRTVAITMNISAEIIILLFFCLTPGELGTRFCEIGRTDVAARPFHAGGQSEVDGVWVVVVGA